MRAFFQSLLLLAISLLTACQTTAAKPLAADEGASTELALNLANRTGRVSAGDMVHTIELEKILDSRCPANAKCIWAGELAAELTVTKHTTQPHKEQSKTVTLGETTAPAASALGINLEIKSIGESSVTLRISREK
jgi:hypothetical protein